MDLNNKCNLKCRMCYFALDLKKEPYKVMDLDLFRKIADEVFPKALQVNFSCAAEPLIIEGFPDYIAIAKKYGIPSKVLVTNAFFMGEKMIRAMIDSEVSHVDVSMDGARADTYETIRKGSNFDRVIDNVRLLEKIKHEEGKTEPLLYLDYALMKSNIHELPDFLRLAKELGAAQVRANHLIPFKGLNIMDESLANCKEETNKVLDEARIVAKDLDLKTELPPDFSVEDAGENVPLFNKPDCQTPFNSMYITSEGKVIPCVWFSSKKYLAGDLKTDSFNEIWNGKVYEDLRERFKHGEFTEHCLNCPVYGDDNPDGYLFQERERGDIGNIA